MKVDEQGVPREGGRGLVRGVPVDARRGTERTELPQRLVGPVEKVDERPRAGTEVADTVWPRERRLVEKHATLPFELHTHLLP